ncbi:MAG: Ig-like domain-containing protein [Holophagales bacterium]|jgi:uncharacterized protein YjdB|nr:Ig-like domain-containing protein [Holophagales bacterium]
MKKYLYYLYAVVTALTLPLSTACGGSDDAVGVTGVTLTPATATLSVGQTRTLAAAVLPSDATNKEVTWTSSAPGIANVANGTVTAVAPGQATITVTTEDGDKTAACAVTVTPSVDSVSVYPFTVALQVGRTQVLTANVLPVNARNKDVTWTSSAPDIAAVANGTVTAVGPGLATITVTTVDGNKTAACAVAVTPIAYSNPVTGLSLAPTALTLMPGQNQSLTATISPGDATNKGVLWSTSNLAVASVTNGRVTALAPGQATITATSDDGGYTAACSVTVNFVPVSGISLNRSKFFLGAGSSITLTPTIEPANATNKNVIWTSSNPGVAAVYDLGYVQALATGSTIITARTEDGGFESSCELTAADVYLGGGGTLYPWIMKNGVAQPLIPQEQWFFTWFGGVNAIAITDDGDFYAAGWLNSAENGSNFQGRRPLLWKNGDVYQELASGDFYGEYATGMAIAPNGDLYISGAAANQAPGYEDVPRLWKNGVIQNLENINSYSRANAVAVAPNGDVYVAGYAKRLANYYYQPAIWKNGVGTILDEPGIHSTAEAVAVSASGDVYAAGNYRLYIGGVYYHYPVIWKNGVMQPLEMPAGVNEMFPTCIFISGEDIYVGGYYSERLSSGFTASYFVYWDNTGVPHLAGYGQPQSICVLGNTVFMSGTVLEPQEGNPGWFWGRGGYLIDGEPIYLDHQDANAIIAK